MRYYVYIYYDGDIPIYVGKGQRGRARSHLKRSNNKGLRHFLLKCADEKRLVEPAIVCRTNDEIEAYARERAYIISFGRRDLGTGSLFNLVEGSIPDERLEAPVFDRTKTLLSDPEFKIRTARTKAELPKTLIEREREVIEDWYKRNKKGMKAAKFSLKKLELPNKHVPRGFARIRVVIRGQRRYKLIRFDKAEWDKVSTLDWVV